jgi:nicotinate-nucleotide adenylyltransferase
MQSVVQPVVQVPVRRLLTLGGSFNPIHVGHLVCARAAAEAAGYAGVRLMPAGANPHKPTADMATAESRLTMCQLAVAGDPFYVVDGREVRRPGASFTYDTATELALTTEERVAWLVGTDLLARLNSWHRFDELLLKIDFVVMRRAGHAIDLAGLDPRVAELAERAVVVPAIEVSATTIRQRTRSGQSIEHLVPPAVARFIANQAVFS